MPGQDAQRLRQEMGRAFSDEQVALLRALRSELSSMRWQVMLEIDAAQEDVRTVFGITCEAEVRLSLERIQARLLRAHQQLAHIPEDVIPAF